MSRAARAAVAAAATARPERSASAEPSTDAARSGFWASSRTTIVVRPASASTPKSCTKESASAKRP
jgi:hypothetical protein